MESKLILGVTSMYHLEYSVPYRCHACVDARGDHTQFMKYKGSLIFGSTYIKCTSVR